MAIDTTYLDADSDKIKLARPSLLAAVQRLNDIEAQTSGNGASHIGFLPSGASASARTAFAKMSDIVSTSDYSSLGAALTAAGNKPVHDPIGITHKNTYSNNANTFLESGETTWKAALIARSSESTGSHVGTAYSAYQIEHRPIGSGASGPTNADYGLTVSSIKQNFSATTVAGEIDAVNIVLRNGASGDSCAILANVATYGTGFQAIYEGQTSIISSSTVTHQIQTQFGICDNGNGTYIGFFANANTGTLGAAYQADSTAGASWTHLLKGLVSGVERFNITAGGQINMIDSGGGKKTLRVLSNNFSIVNAAGSAEVMNLTDAGVMTLGSSIVASRANLSGAPDTVGAGFVSIGGTTAASASAGSSGAPPAQVAGYLNINVGGTSRKIPYYAS